MDRRFFSAALSFATIRHGALALSVALCACSSSGATNTPGAGDDPPLGGDGGGGKSPSPGAGRMSMRAKVNGVEIIADEVEGTHARSGDGREILLLIGDVTSGGGRRLLLSLQKDYGVGTYPFTEVALENNDHFAHYEVEIDEQSHIGVAASGELKISAHDPATRSIEGTFEFVTKSQLPSVAGVNVTEGSFSIVYEPIPGL